MLDKLNPFMNYIKLAVVLAVFSAGYATCNHFAQKKIDELNQSLGEYKSAYTSLAATTAEQNTAIDKMEAEAKQREVQANNAIQDALTAAAEANTRVQKILLAKPPKGKNQCLAARQAFADELRAERGGK